MAFTSDLEAETNRSARVRQMKHITDLGLVTHDTIISPQCRTLTGTVHMFSISSQDGADQQGRHGGSRVGFTQNGQLCTVIWSLRDVYYPAMVNMAARTPDTGGTWPPPPPPPYYRMCFDYPVFLLLN